MYNFHLSFIVHRTQFHTFHIFANIVISSDMLLTDSVHMCVFYLIWVYCFIRILVLWFYKKIRIIVMGNYFILFSIFLAFARVLSVLPGHSVFSSPPQRPMTSDFEGFSIPDFINNIYFPILILEKEPVFSLFNVQC